VAYAVSNLAGMRMFEARLAAHDVDAYEAVNAQHCL